MNKDNLLFFLFIYDDENENKTKTIWKLIHTHKLGHLITPIPAKSLQASYHLLYNTHSIKLTQLPCILKYEEGKSTHIYQMEHIESELIPILNNIQS